MSKTNILDNIISNKSLCKKYTFQNYNLSTDNFNIFILLKNIKEQDEQYNPIVVYGKKGSGKTHLISAAANNLLKSNEKIIYLKINKFNELCQEYEKKEIDGESFHNIINKIKESDYIFFEDIENLSTSFFTSNTFFHLFNDLYNSNKKIVITCIKEPDELENIEPRISCRLHWGLTWDLEKFND